MSVEVRRLRAELFAEALRNGWYSPAHVKEPFTSLIPPARLERWFTRFYEAPKAPIVSSNRLANRFSLGADPEFVCHSPEAGYIKASQFGLKAGLAFGADNNGRLIELRPMPTRSALELVASVWSTMRWLWAFNPKVGEYQWRAGAFYQNDGIGGHLHFGRGYKERRKNEVQALDKLAFLLFAGNVFSREEGRARYLHAQGAHNVQYGSLSDVRKQTYGFEYRTLPSWLDSPWLAFFVATLSKLVVAKPELLTPLTAEDGFTSPNKAQGLLRFILAYCAPVDDDARLALTIAQHRGLPMHIGGADFKGNWGIFIGGAFGVDLPKCPQVIPTAIPASLEDQTELARAMFEGRPPGLPKFEPTWAPTVLPAGYHPVIHTVDTRLAPGLGEFVADLCYHEDEPITITNYGAGQNVFGFDERLHERILRCGLARQIAPLVFNYRHGDELYMIWINAADQPAAHLARAKGAIIDSRLWPLWRIDKVRGSSLGEFRLRSKSVFRRFTSKKIYTGG